MNTETQEFYQLGKVTVSVVGDEVVGVKFNTQDYQEPSSTTNLFFVQLQEYLNHQRTHFDLTIKMPDLPDSYKAVFHELQKVNYGEVISYEELANRANIINGSRVAGTMCAKNPLPLIVPCHRVILKNGNTGNYQAGRSVKETLINLEQQHVAYL